MLRKVLFCCFPVLFAALAWSETPSFKGEVYGAYSYTSPNFHDEGSGENGWNAGAAVNATRWISLKADFAQYRYTYTRLCCPHDHSTTTTYLFGPQFSVPSTVPWIRPFVQLLIGRAHIDYANLAGTPSYNQTTSVALDLGGGLDLRLSHHFWLRGEADYLHNHFTINDSQVPRPPTSHARVVTGIVFRF